MYISVFCRSDGAGNATTRNTRGLTRSVIALMRPPLPAASRPSKTIATRRPLALTQSCTAHNFACRRTSSFSYFLRGSLDMDGSLEVIALGGIHRTTAPLRLPTAAERPVQLGARLQLGPTCLRQQ